MKIVKVDAIDSTNTFLKEWCQLEFVEDFTVVVAKNQTKGRGQQGNTWSVKSGKNLTFSVLVRLSNLDLNNQFSLSKVVALAIKKTLVKFLPINVYVKWPNDIMAENKKLAGVLIENTVKKQQISQSVIGIGLNVNQVDFSDLPKATSLKNITEKDYDLSALLDHILNELRINLEILIQGDFKTINQEYLENLYKLNVPQMFKDANNNQFMGKIVGVSKLGKLQVELEDESIKEFDLKEITML